MFFHNFVYMKKYKVAQNLRFSREGMLLSEKPGSAKIVGNAGCYRSLLGVDTAAISTLMPSKI